MRTFPSKRGATRGLVIFLLALAAAGFAACRRADLPEKDSPQYTNAVRAFYVGLSALQVGDDVRAEAKLKEATALAPDEPAAWADLGLLYMRQRAVRRGRREPGEGARSSRPRTPRSTSCSVSSRARAATPPRPSNSFRRAAELDPRNLKALYALSREVEREGEGGEDEELRLLQKILEVEPRQPRPCVSTWRGSRPSAATRELFGRLIARLRRGLRRVAAGGAGAVRRPSRPRPRAEHARRRAARAVPPQRARAPARIQAEPPRRRRPARDLERALHALHHAGVAFARARAAGRGADLQRRAVAGVRRGRLGVGRRASRSTARARPRSLFADGARRAQLAGGVKLAFPGGAVVATPPTPNGVAALDFNYDFKTDLALAGAGGFRLYRQESPTSFADVTAQTKLPAATSPARLTRARGRRTSRPTATSTSCSALEGRRAARSCGTTATARSPSMQPFEGVAALRDFAWADLDGDGDPDAALLDARGQLAVFTNERAGQFRARAVAAEPGPAVALARRRREQRRAVRPAAARRATACSSRLSDKDEGAGWDVGAKSRAGDGRGRRGSRPGTCSLRRRPRQQRRPRPARLRPLTGDARRG